MSFFLSFLIGDSLNGHANGHERLTVRNVGRLGTFKFKPERSYALERMVKDVHDPFTFTLQKRKILNKSNKLKSNQLVLAALLCRSGKSTESYRSYKSQHPVNRASLLL
jgi:hypothetical protein